MLLTRVNCEKCVRTLRENYSSGEVWPRFYLEQVVTRDSKREMYLEASTNAAWLGDE